MERDFVSRLVGKMRPKRSATPHVDDGRQFVKSATRETLEEAYRELLVEHQVVAETNARLHQRLAEQADGMEDSPAAKRLISSQRKALAERSRVQRELGYENKRLQLEQRRLVEELQSLRTRISHQVGELQKLREQIAAQRTELTETKALLRAKSDELDALTTKYHLMISKTGS